MDHTAPLFTSVSPLSNSAVTSMDAGYSLSEDLASGTITWAWSGGSADPSSPHVRALSGSELSTGSHSGVAASGLVDGTVYSITFEGKDLAGNAATPVTNTNIAYGVSAPAGTTARFQPSSPAANGFVNSMLAGYSLNEAIASGTITWTRTGGAEDLASPHIRTLSGSELAAGSHGGVAAFGLVDGAVYSIAFDGLDASGQALPRPVIDNVAYVATPPRIVSATWNSG